MNRLYESWEENLDIGFVIMKVLHGVSTMLYPKLHMVDYVVNKDVDCFERVVEGLSVPVQILLASFACLMKVVHFLMLVFSFLKGLS